jgi:hypothetical protein
MRRRVRKKKHTTDRHHRKPRSLGGDNSERNLIRVDKEKHVLWHRFVGNKTVHEIAEYLSKWIDPDYKLIAVRRENA